MACVVETRDIKSHSPRAKVAPKGRGMKPLLLILFALTSAACGVDPQTPSEVTLAARGEYGALEFEITADGPITEGRNPLQIVVRHEDAPIDDAELKLRAWMPAMQHEHTEATCVPDADEGYTVEDLVFSMPGLWKLEIQADAGDLSDIAEVTVEVR